MPIRGEPLDLLGRCPTDALFREEPPVDLFGVYRCLRGSRFDLFGPGWLPSTTSNATTP
eukprot:gene21543-28535_t